MSMASPCVVLVNTADEKLGEMAGRIARVEVDAETADLIDYSALLAKLAILRGAGAEAFLKAGEVRAWCVR